MHQILFPASAVRSSARPFICSCQTQSKRLTDGRTMMMSLCRHFRSGDIINKNIQQDIPGSSNKWYNIHEI